MTGGRFGMSANQALFAPPLPFTGEGWGEGGCGGELVEKREIAPFRLFTLLRVRKKR
jgi:hypothetical protein